MATFTFRIDDDQKQRLIQLARKLDRTPSNLMMVLIDQALTENRELLSEGTSGEETQRAPASHKVTARLAPDEHRKLRQRAEKDVMKPSTWVAALIRGKLLDTHTFNPEEIAALKESTRQLQAIGRNLNQLVRLTNIESRESEGLKQDDIKRLTADIKTHTQRVGALLTGNLERWTQ